MPESGNHGRNSNESSPPGIGNLVPSTTPQQSVRGFVSPSSMPIKKTPDITDIIGEKEVPVGRGSLYENNPTSNIQLSDVGKSDTKQRFPTQWRTMFNQVFASVPTIYIPLKETLPEVDDNIIKITVKNQIQKEHFESKTREIIDFLKTHYDKQIKDIVVETNERLETKKIIYDVKEKLQNFKDQNNNFEDFLQILDLKIKD